MKVITTVLSMACLLLGMQAKAQSFSADGINYTVLSASEGTVTVAGAKATTSELVIPETVEYRSKAYRVTAIKESAFNGMTQLTSVVIPASVTTYGKVCFANCQELSEVTLSPSAESLSLGMFSSCKSLTSIAIPEGVNEIQQQAFWSCSALESVNLPSTLQTLGLACFEMCSSLQEIDVPAGVKALPKEMLAFCTNLERVALSEGLEEIGDYAFELCHSLADISVPDGVRTIGTNAFLADTCLTRLRIPASVEAIGERAFGSTWALEAFDTDAANASFTSVDGVLFSKDLTTLLAYPNGKARQEPEYTVPASVSTIAPSAFYGAKSLVHIELPDGLTSIGSWAFWSARALREITIPSGITAITEGMLRDCTDLESITLPDGLTTIGAQGLSGCAALEHITLPESLTTLGMLAFNTCLSLRDIVVPDGVTELPLMCFNGCTSLETVVLGSGIASFGVNAFGNDIAIESVYSHSIVPPSSATFPAQVYELATLYVPAEAQEAYRSASGWKEFSNIKAGVWTGIGSTASAAAQGARRWYTLGGQQMHRLQKGIGIVKEGDAPAMKVLR